MISIPIFGKDAAIKESKIITAVIDVNYDQHAVGQLSFGFPSIINLEEHVLSPSIGIVDGELQVLGYSLVHISLLPPVDVWQEKIKELRGLL
jgi:hypothetical protein